MNNFATSSVPSRRASKVDIIVCLDITGSMRPCINKLKESIGAFVESLEEPVLIKQAQVLVKVSDWRIRLFPYRDLAAPHKLPAMMENFPFVNSTEAFRKQLGDSRVVAKGGGGDGPESTMDAIFRASCSKDWRESSDVKRYIIVFTDNVTLPLHHTTIGDQPNDLDMFVQIINTNNVSLIVFGVDCLEYKRLVDLSEVGRKTSRLFRRTTEAKQFFNGSIQQFTEVIKEIGQGISSSSSPR